MTSDIHPNQDQASYELVRSLAKLLTSDLVRFTLQKPDVARVFASSLNSLAVEAASSSLPTASDAQLARSHIDILARLIERGDPSLARKFVPTQGSLLDLAVATPVEAKSVTASVLERLLDATSVKEILDGLSSQLKTVASSQRNQDADAIAPVIRTLARLSFAFLSVCPSRLIKGNITTISTWTQTCLQTYDRVLPQVAKDLAGDAADNALEPDLSKLDSQSWRLHWLTCRVDLLQLISILFDTLKGSASFVAVVRDALADTDKLLKKGGFSTLLNSTALLDLAATSDSWPSLRSELLSNAALKKNKADETIASIDALATTVPKFSGAAWDALQRFVTLPTSNPAVQSDQRPSRKAPAVSEEVLASVDSVLPHYGIDRLRTILSRPSFAGQNAEMVIQRLLEGDEGDADLNAPSASSQLDPAAMPHPPPASAPLPTQQPAADLQPPSSTAPSLVRSRANLFGDFGFDPSTIIQPKLARTGKVDELAPELKAAILARAEAADDDETEEEWNPFAEPQRTVGVEDELDLDYDGRERTALPRRTHDDEDSDQENDEDEAARARERILLKAYVQHGSHVFASTPTAHRSDTRQKLKTQTGWSDDLIESWAVMLDRNPKKDRLLAAASQSELDEQLASTRNALSNRGDTAGHEDEEEEDHRQHSAARRFGPDRGRGGRILHGGAGRGGSRAGGHTHTDTLSSSGGGGGGGGHHQPNKNATRGKGTGNSGTDRSARQKEKAGNKARQKGHDKKMARVNP